MHPSPQFSRRSVIGCVAKNELTKKGVMKECLVLKQRFFGKKRVIIIRYIISDLQQIQGKYRQTDKGHQKFSTSKWKFFLKKFVRKFGPRNTFSASYQTRRQVSAHGLTGPIRSPEAVILTLDPFFLIHFISWAYLGGSFTGFNPQLMLYCCKRLKLQENSTKFNATLEMLLEQRQIQLCYQRITNSYYQYRPTHRSPDTGQSLQYCHVILQRNALQKPLADTGQNQIPPIGNLWV